MGGGAEPAICPKCSTILNPGDSVCSKCGAEASRLSRTITSGFEVFPGEDVWERFEPGKVFANRYTIIEEIGVGGMGRVYKAIDKYLGIIVALKIIRPEYASNLRMIEHFKKELILARSISSEYVVRVHDLGESEDTKYISMDYVEGQNLRDLIKTSGSLTIPTAVKFGEQICSALSAAHRAEVIHRDLKPSNVMIEKGGRVQVMDFGLAKALDRKEPHREGAVAGTPAYMSPEQARGEILDERTDIYSLGLILYEMVTGCPVFEAERTTEYIKKHCSVDPEPPSRLNPMVPPGLETVILKCLKKDKTERFQAVEEVCRSLELVIAPVVAPPKPPRSIILRILVGVFAFAAAALAVYFLFFRGNGPPEREILKSLAVMSFRNVTGDPSMDQMRQLLPNLLFMDLEQSKYLRLISRERLLKCMKDLGLDDDQVFRPDDLDRIAARENVDFFLLGNFMAIGQRYQIEIQVNRARPQDTIGVGRFEFTVLNDIYNRCDEISRWTKSRLGLTRSELAEDFDEELLKYTTSSIEAVTLFSRGLDFYNKGDLKKSTECYLQAIGIDRNFAVAYARLALNSIYAGKREEANTHIKKAMSLSENLTHRERLLIEGDFFNFGEDDWPRAIEKYQNLLLLYPDHETALEHLGAIYRNTEEWDMAARCFERLRDINPTRIVARNLSFIYQAQGQYEKASDVIRKNEAILVSGGQYFRELAFCNFCQGKVDEAFQELGIALDQGPHEFGCLRLLGQLSMVKGHYREAEAAYRRLLESDREDLDKLGALFWLGHLYLLQGKFRDCHMVIQEGLEFAGKQGFPYDELTFLLFKSDFHRLQGDFAKAYEAAIMARQKAVDVRDKPEEIKALLLIGLCQVEIGEVSEAHATVSTMAQIIENMGFRKLMRDCHHLEGMIAFSQRSWEEAITQFSNATELLSHQNFILDKHALYLEALASALYLSDDLDRARAEYEKVVSLTTGMLTSGDGYARSLLQLGKICKIKDDPERAREYLRKYLEIRADADAGLPEVEEARRLLASLS